MKQTNTYFLSNKNKPIQCNQKDNNQQKDIVNRKRTVKVQSNKINVNRQKLQFKHSNNKNINNNISTFPDAINRIKKIFELKSNFQHEDQFSKDDNYRTSPQHLTKSKTKVNYKIPLIQQLSRKPNLKANLNTIKDNNYLVQKKNKKKMRLKTKSQLNSQRQYKNKSKEKIIDYNIKQNRNKNDKFNKQFHKNYTNNTQAKTQRNIQQIYRKNSKRKHTQINAHKVQSIIVYDFSPDQQQKQYFLISKSHNFDSAIKTIQKYFKNFHEQLIYKNLSQAFQNVASISSLNYNSSEQSQKLQSTKIQSFFRNQQTKWLKLKYKLERIRDGISSQNLQSLIKQVEQNHYQLKTLQINDLKKHKQIKNSCNINPKQKKQFQRSQKHNLNNFESNNQRNKQSPQFVRTPINKLSYQQAPLQIRNLLKRKSKQELIKQSQNISRELSQKQILFDIQLPNHLASKSSHKNDSLLIKSASPKNNKQLNSYCNKSQFQKPQIFKNQPTSKSPLLQNSLDNKPEDFFKNIKQDNLGKNINNAIKIDQEQKKVIVQQKINIKNTDNSQSLIISYPLKQNFQDQEQVNKIRIQIDSERCQNFLKQVEFYIIDLLINEIIRQFTNSQKKQIFQYYNSQNIKVQKQWDRFLGGGIIEQQKQSIKLDINYILNLTQNMLGFLENNEQKLNDFNRKLLTPLGLQSKDFLKQMRRIKKNQYNWEEPFDNEYQQQSQQGNIYEYIIQLEQIYQFQRIQQSYRQENDEYNSKMTHFQQIYNQAIFDAINLYLDQLRPYGEIGLPPICFPHNFILPSMSNIKKHIFRQFKNDLSIKLGLLNYGDPLQTKQIIKNSMQKFVRQISKQFDRNWFCLQQLKFDICYELMNVIEQQIFNQSIFEMHFLLQQFLD